MKNILIVMLLLLLSAAAHSKDSVDPVRIQTETFADGILLQADDDGVYLELTVVGPDDTRTTRSIQSDSGFIHVQDLGGQIPVDGQYKWEVWPTPVVTYSRDENLEIPEGNHPGHKNVRKVSPVSGSFRVVNGLIVDPDLVEHTKEGLQ